MNREQSAALAGRAIGAMFFAGFGALWLVWWCVESQGASPGVLAGIALGAVCIGMLARRRWQRHRDAARALADSPAMRRARRVFNLVNAGQWVAVVIAALWLSSTGHPEWIRVAIILIVGLHFLPLGVVFHYPMHLVTGSALIALALIYPLVSTAGPLNPVGLLGTGIVLWVSALVALGWSRH